MEDSRTAPATIVGSTALPYKMALDIIMSGIRLVLAFGSAYYLVSRFAAQRVDYAEWSFAVLFAIFGLRLQFRANRLVIDQDGLQYTTLLGPTRRVPWEAIRSVRTGTGDISFHGIPVKGSLKRKGPGYATILELGDGEPPVVINIKPFAVQSIVVFASFLVERARQADIDEATRNLIQGVVPSIFLGSQKGHG